MNRCLSNFTLTIGLLFAALVTGNAQRTFSIALAPTNQNRVAISWKAGSATPVGDLIVVPQFLLQRSRDLNTWTAVAPVLSPSLNQIVTVTDSNSAAAFYRVQSMIQREYGEFPHAKLDFAGFAGADFLGADFFGASLANADLGGANLAAADLQQAHLTQANLSRADLFNVQASSAVFDLASFTGADASFADFENASFQEADFSGANLSFSILTGADFSFTFWHGAVIDTNTIIDANPKLVWRIVNQGAPGATLTNVDISFATLTNVNLNGAKLNGSDLFGDDLRQADIRGANFTSANVDFIDLRGTLLDITTTIDNRSRVVWQIQNVPNPSRDIHETNISSSFLFQANLSGANMTNIICTNAFCEQINLGGANLTRGNFNNTDFFSASITNANLTQALFRFVDLTSASLRNSITNGADFTGATFSNTIMPDGSVRNF